ncbi:MAG: hypothetical protein ACREDY_10800, partial [Bradyrhizobium sp.]
MMSLPAAAFNYQFYPEAAGGLLLTVAVAYATLSADTRKMPAFICGVVTGYLPWMHPRWGPAAMIAGTVALLRLRRSPARFPYLFGFGAALAWFFAYTYYIGGTLVPWRTYEATTAGFAGTSVPRGLTEYWLNWQLGLLANAPFYILAALGLVTFVRRRPGAAMTILSIVGSTAALAASHAWAGGGSPCRLIASVVPLLMLPVSDAIRTFRSSRAFIVIVLLLAALSVRNGFAYNASFDYGYMALQAPGVSGWNTPLLFSPPNGGDPNGWLLWFWGIVTAALIAFPLFRRRRSVSRALWFARRPSQAWTLVTAVVLVMFASGASLLAMATGHANAYRYFDDQRSADTALFDHASPGAVVWTSDHGWAPVRIAIGSIAAGVGLPD